MKNSASTVAMAARSVTIALLLIAASAVRTPALQATLGGRHFDLDATLSVREVIEENHATTHDRTLEQLRVRVAAAPTDWLRFDSTMVGSNGGPTFKSDRAGIYDLDRAFQDISPALDFEEAYADVLLPSLDLRIGKQKVAWGKLDRTQPNDLINTLSYLDPILEEEAERKIGVPAVQGSYYFNSDFPLPESRLTVVWVPMYVPYRFPLARCDVQHGASHCDVERWFPPAAVPTTTFGIPAGLIPLGNGMFNPPITVPLSFRVQNGSTPSLRVENSEVGVRYAALVQDADVAAYYFHGFDPQPAFRLTAEAVGDPDPNPANPLHVSNLSGATTLSPEYHQIDSGGADLAYALGRFTLRGEGAFITQRPFTRDLRVLITDPRSIAAEIAKALGGLARGAGRVPVELPASFVQRDSVEWGVGGDYVYEGYMVLLQVNQTDVLRNHVDLLIKDVETRVLANVRKSFWADTLQTQLVAVHAIESDYTLVRPRLTYRVTDNLSAEVGYLFIAGRARSLIGQYRRNDEGWVRLEFRI